MYWLASCGVDTDEYILNIIPFTTLFETINGSIKSAPIKTFHISCYHWKERFNQSDEKVVTYRAVKRFNCDQFVDQSPSPSVLNYLEMLKLVRLHTSVHVSLSPQASLRYKDEKDKFIKDNTKDAYYEFSERTVIPGIKNH